MKDEMFTELMASLREGADILKGAKEPSRTTVFSSLDTRAIREKLQLTQVQFASLMGISVRTLQNWEQGHRTPEGPARALLRVAELHPEAVLDALH